MADELQKHRRLAAIMFTDMVGYSALSRKNEALALELLDEHRRLLREAFARHDGREIEAVGDGFFVEFPSALSAARCAADIQRVLHDRNAMQSPDRRVLVRIGLHLGDVVAQGQRVHGDGVNIAARIERVAEPGTVCLSEDVARQIQNKIELPLHKVGRPELKNIDLPVEIYRLVLPWETANRSVTAQLSGSLQRRQTRRTLIGAGTVMIVIALVVAYAWHRSVGPPITNNRLAVLPFVSLSPDQTDEYFADGITEELIARLSRIAGLEVIARTSVMSYKGTTKKIADIGRDLKVGTVLEGSVRKDGDKLRITAQLIRVDNEAHLWADSYDQDTKDAFAIQKNIANRVAVALSARLGTATAVANEPRGTQSTEAYNAYLKGRFHTNKSSLEGLKEGIKHFEEAVRLDSSFALGYVGLAEAYQQLPMQDDTYSNTAYPAARLAAQRAIDLDPTLAEAHAALGVVKTFYEYDWSGAEEEFQRALALNPNSSTTHWWYAWYNMFLRRFDQGIAEMRRAVELDPVSIAKNMDLGWAYQFPGRWDESIEQLNRTLEMDRANPQVLAAFGWAYMGKKIYPEAEAAFVKEVEAFGREPWSLIDLIAVHALAGDLKRATMVLNEIKQASKTEPVSGWSWVIAYYGFAVRDEQYRDELFEWLNKSVDQHSFWVLHTSTQWWAPFHSDPRWLTLRKRLGLPA
jgi:TolB-like protein/class 3 adenylate cyclase/Tfp pilus assembly protein PilF